LFRAASQVRGVDEHAPLLPRHDEDAEQAAERCSLSWAAANDTLGPGSIAPERTASLGPSVRPPPMRDDAPTLPP
jgi:hypothetical protein